MEHLSLNLMWFKVSFGLKINEEESELILVQLTIDVENLAKVLGCKVGTLPTSYLRMPIGAPFR